MSRSSLLIRIPFIVLALSTVSAQTPARPAAHQRSALPRRGRSPP